MLTEVEDAYNLEVTSRFPGTSLPLFTSCAAVMWDYVLLLVLSGTLAASATGGRRVRVLIPLVLQLRRTTSRWSLPVFYRRTARVFAGSVSPSAALVLCRVTHKTEANRINNVI